ncbi:hypothetical protein GN244_ATG00730 [Phytophthora infestans]|uniref:Uncharacterized protein n=1 Tax=Phytophthora infestans TaxID=4787 RepID=A0A833WN95_PHYIN|nr:hypothetical protein GN244_ATG00730 [Phytophthora infestans]
MDGPESPLSTTTSRLFLSCVYFAKMQVKQHEYSSTEKKMVKEQGLFCGKRTIELVAECLGCSTDTVARVIAVYNAS